MKTNEAIYWVIEKTGENRQVFGPYEMARAQREAGKRYAIVTGSGLENGQTMTRGALQAAVQSGRIRVADGSDATVLA